jgi:sugar/nucleoside kinase (ribokinase family)
VIKTTDVTAIGNAIVDVVTTVDEDFLIDHSVDKGAMTLINAEQLQSLLPKTRGAKIISGGSAANTIVGFSMLGGSGAYIGKVKNDAAGNAFKKDLKDLGVSYTTMSNSSGPATAQCLVFVTEDAQRSMATYLGACVSLEPSDIDFKTIEASKVIYLEGYLWDPPNAKEAIKKAIELAHSTNCKVALSLSDAFCVNRYRTEFLDLVSNQVDILFANESEIISLYQADNINKALDALPDNGSIAAITLGEKGSIIKRAEDRWVIPAQKTPNIVDTTGAGDLYAAGFLYAFINNYTLDNCGKLGGLAASEIIQQYGARTKTDFKSLLASIE